VLIAVAFWSDWSFSKKLFALLIFPIALQFIFFLALCLALNHAQSLSERQFQEQQLIAALDRVLLDRGTTFTGMVRRSMFGVVLEGEAKKQLQESIAENIRLVRESPVVDSTILRSISEIEESYKAEKEQDLHELSVLARFQRLAGWGASLKGFHDQILLKLQKNGEEYAADRHKIDLLKAALTGGMLLDLLAALASVYIFNRNLKSSLHALTENSMNVPNDAELPNKLEGSDELCIIDNALHLSHSRLQEAKERRKTVNAMIAHDVRTPLMAIALLSQKLSHELSRTGSPLSGEVKRMERHIQAVHNHVEDLLVVEKLDDGKIDLKLQEVDLKAMLGDVCSSVFDVAQEKEVSIRLDADDCSVIGDRLRLEQVVQNYLSNAIRYSPAGSEIGVRLIASPNEVIVRVTDTGVGIKLNEQSQLFNKFFQAGSTKNEKGFGLGLSICKRLIELHGGEVGVSSRPGHGAVFWFSLPIDEMD
jgi:signal transduction histidine kinase